MNQIPFFWPKWRKMIIVKELDFDEGADYMDLDLSLYYDAEEDCRQYGKVHKKTVNNRVYKRARKRVISRKTGKCDRCPWHRGENSGLSRQPKDDKHKSRKRERKFKFGCVEQCGELS